MHLLPILLLVTLATPVSAEPIKTAVFDLELVDTSQEGAGGKARADEAQRLILASAELRKLLADSGRFELIDLGSEKARIEEKAPIHKCNGCAEEIAAKLGADYDVVGIVQKTSNLILHFLVVIKNAKTGAVVRAGQVDIRGNDDVSWLRGLRYLVKNRLLAEPLPSPT